MPTDIRSSPRPMPARKRAASLHAGVRHARRMRDQALDAAQGLGQREAFEPFEERLDRGLAAGELETQHGAEAALLAARDLVPG
jgi:hypothetical protein